MKRIQQLIVANSYVLANRPAIGGIPGNAWAAGGITILKEDFSVYDAAGADAAYDGDIMIARFDADNEIYATEFLKKGSVKAISDQVYQAPVLQRIDIDLAGLTPVAGELVGVQTINKSNREVVYLGRRQYVVKSTGTLQTDIDNVAAAITADRFNDATAARSGDILQITAAAFDSDLHISEPNLSVSTLEGWSSYSPATGVAAVAGIGTPDKVSLIEELEDFGKRGVLNFREFPVIPQSVVDSGATYNMFTLEIDTKWGGTMGVAVGDTAPKSIIIAMDAGGTGAALLQTSLNTWLNVKIDDLPGA